MNAMVPEAPGTADSGGKLRRAWHALTAEAVAQTLSSAPHGLTGDEARARLQRFGPNRLPQAKKRGPLLRFLLQFHNLLIYVLLAAALLAVAIGHLVDSLVIFAVVLINAIVGFLQEGRAEQALEAIRGMIDPRASVIRDGRPAAGPALRSPPVRNRSSAGSARWSERWRR